jgi:hypothetical protein
VESPCGTSLNMSARSRKQGQGAEVPPDPSKPLKNPKWEACLSCFFKSVPQADLAVICHKVGGYKKGPASCNQASRMMKNDDWKRRLAWFQEQAASKAVLTKQEYAEMLTRICRTKHSDFLTMSADGVWFHDIGPDTLNQEALKKVRTRVQTEKSGRGEEEITIEKQFDEIELESKLSAGKQLAELFGWNEPTKQDHKIYGPITVITNTPTPKPLPKRLALKD